VGWGNVTPVIVQNVHGYPNNRTGNMMHMSMSIINYMHV
jgi:hypothetical protein